MTLPNYAFFRGKIVPYSEAKIGVMTHALNYGTAVFAGVRGYWNEEEEELFVFRPMDHFHRFLNSMKLMVMENAFSEESLTQIIVELLQKEGLRQDVYIRPLAYKSDEIIGVKLHDLHTDVTIFAVPFERYVANDTGAHVTISSWRRVDDNMIPLAARSPALMPTRLSLKPMRYAPASMKPWYSMWMATSPKAAPKTSSWFATASLLLRPLRTIFWKASPAAP